MLHSRLTVRVTPGLLLSLYLLVIYLPYIEANLGDSCSNCTGTNEICQNGNGTCVCEEAFFDSNGTDPGGTCDLKVVLGSNCSNVTGVQVCKDANAACSNGKCACGSDYFDDNGATPNGTCQLKVSLGSNCPQPDACITANASCNVSSASVSNICVCNMDYYDNNGIEPNGTCRPVSDLQVTSLNTGTINEGSITIMWTAPTGKENFIDYFILIYGPSDNTGSEIVKNGTLTNVTLENLVPGKKYKIKITSVNRQTALSERTISNTFYKISKPSKPGNLQKRENIDVVSGNITLKWNVSEGVVNGYAVSLANETYNYSQYRYNESYSINTTAQQTFTNVRNGTIYRFRVYAFSGDTDTGVLNSDDRTDNITTTVQIPNPPTNLNCLNPTDRTFNLTWMQPEFPNGDIISYIIVIQRTNPSQEPYNETSQGTQYTVVGLTAGSFYKFQVYTRNVLYTSILSATVASCQTSPRMVEMPAELQIKDVTSRSGNVTWSKPTNFSGVHYGYNLQIRNGSSCIREVIWRCIGCEGSFPHNLSRPCSDVSEQNASSTALNGSQYYEVALLPDTNYTVDVAAITGLGIGHQATKYFATKEEAPSKPSISLVRNITAKTATVEWNMDEVRPGQTNYTIIATGISPAERRTRLVSGFYNRTYEFIDLEEYWNYSVIVQATTSIGSNHSDPNSFTTLAGPAGPVNNFNVSKGLGDDMYVTARVSWILPDELKRNGPINSFYVQQRQNNASGTSLEVNKTTIKRENDNTFIYNVTFNVDPEENYTIMVRADTGNLTGEEKVINYTAPAGPPVNIENPGYSVVPADRASVHSKTSFRVEVDRNFFTNSKNGAIQDKGLICCKDPICMNDISTIRTYVETKKMNTYAQAKQNGSIKYRLPNTNTTREQVSGRRKRAYNPYVYDVGIESCDGLRTDEYCNGPLDPGSTYRIIAFVCTSTWCTLSKSYGPFITLSGDSNKNSNTGSTSLDTPVIVGIVCGTFFLTTLVIACTIIIIRTTRTTRRSTDTNQGDTYMDLACRTNENPYMSCKAPVYDSIPADS